MGKKEKITGKERRAALRDEKRRAVACRARVSRAKDKLNPLDELSVPLEVALEMVGFDAVISCAHWKNLDPETAAWILGLEETNVRDMYEKSDWGWKPDEKKEEMMDEDARYLIAKAHDGKYLGFSHFRFDMDYDDEVLYCYELQIEEHAQRKGLGGFMLGVLEALTSHYDMKKTMLTVFKHNHAGNKFFRKHGYKLDETSLEDTEDETFCYEILSKYNCNYTSPIV